MHCIHGHACTSSRDHSSLQGLPPDRDPSSSALSLICYLLLYLPRHTAVGSGPGQPDVKARLGVALHWRSGVRRRSQAQAQAQACSSRLRANGLAFACSSHGGTFLCSRRAWGSGGFFCEGGWISNKRYASRGRRKRVHGSLGGGSVDAWICVSLLGPVSVAACFIYRQLTRLRSAQSDDNVFLELLRSFGAIYILVAGFGCSIVRYPNPVEYTALCIRSLSVARAGVAIKAARS